MRTRGLVVLCVLGVAAVGGGWYFGTSREQKRAARIPKHGFYIAHAVCILCGHEFSEESPCFGFVRGSGCICTQRDCHYGKEKRSLD